MVCNDRTTSDLLVPLLNQHKRDGTIPSDSRHSKSASTRIVSVVYVLELVTGASLRIQSSMFDRLVSSMLPRTDTIQNSQHHTKHCCNNNTWVHS